MDDDIRQLEKYEAGDRDAFDELVRKYQRPLYSLLYRMVSDRDDAAELLQKTFVKAFTGSAGFGRRSSFKTWIYQIAINLAKNLYRDRARAARVPIEDVVLGKAPGTLEGMIEREHRRLLRTALDELPEKQRLTVVLRVQENRKFEEIAGIMRCSLGTAKANYHHAVRKLKGKLGGQVSGGNGEGT